MSQTTRHPTRKFLLGHDDFDFRVTSPPPSPHWPIQGWPAVAKRLIDLCIASLALMLLAMPILLIALLIRADTAGPILFRQCRVGFANSDFRMWKFRTMHHTRTQAGPLRQASRHDPRVTRTGAFLRRWSLDELPQLFNVLRGEMSLVGPRPHAHGTCAGGKPFEQITPHYPARHRVLPGITGLAQVRGWRGETDTEEKLLRRVEADLEYIDNWSLRLDLQILGRTLVRVIAERNAY